MRRFRVTMILSEFNLCVDKDAMDHQIRREFLSALKKDLKEIQPYLEDKEGVGIFFDEIKETYLPKAPELVEILSMIEKDDKNPNLTENYKIELMRLAEAIKVVQKYEP